MEPQAVTLLSLAGGALVELFDAELQTVLRNIDDPNTDPAAARVITIKVQIKPDEDRQLGSVTCGVASKLSAVKNVRTVIYMTGKRAGKYVAVENNPVQLTLEAPAQFSSVEGGKP
jgi:hypothetical protein